MHYQTVLFDLDGTLTDPREGITRSIQFALSKLGIDEPDLNRLEHFIGENLHWQGARIENNPATVILTNGLNTVAGL